MDRKIKILQFPIGNGRGGMTQYVLQNWKFIDKSKFHFDFATMSKGLSFANKLEEDGCKIYYISCYAEENESQFIEEFKNILKAEQYDIVHLHTKQWKSFLVEKLAQEVGVKRIIVHAHNTGIDVRDEVQRNSEFLLHQKRKEELTESMATDFWACSKMAADFLFGDKINADRIKIMNNAIDISKYSYKEEVRQAVRKQLKIKEEILIGHVGRFEYQKNHDFLIEVFGKVCQMKKNVRLLLIGEGELKDTIYQKAVSLGVANKVIFMGFQENVGKWLQAMDIFAFPSHFEGLSISAIEAQASGLPCIMSDQISAETDITGNVRFVSLDVEKWAVEIIGTDTASDRNGAVLAIQNAGYDIRKQIKRIEWEYMSKEDNLNPV